MKKLIFDLAVTGHHSEYISHLVNYIKLNDEHLMVITLRDVVLIFDQEG